MTALAYSRAGAGPSLVLLHGIGSSRRAWAPVIPALAEHFDVVAVDLPGFGDSAPLPAQDEPTPAALAAAVAGFLDELGIVAPHLAGNSLGGWVALELAGIRPAASLALLSPAGMWRRATPLYCKVSLRGSWWMARHATGLLCRMMSYCALRVLILRQTHGRPAGMSPGQARAAIADLASGPGFRATMDATATRRYRAGLPVAAPVTVAFGSRDALLLPWQSRHLDELPPGTLRATLACCGHVPMFDDPGAVTALIMSAASRSSPRPEPCWPEPEPLGGG